MRMRCGWYREIKSRQICYMRRSIIAPTTQPKQPEEVYIQPKLPSHERRETSGQDICDMSGMNTGNMPANQQQHQKQEG